MHSLWECFARCHYHRQKKVLLSYSFCGTAQLSALSSPLSFLSCGGGLRANMEVLGTTHTADLQLARYRPDSIVYETQDNGFRIHLPYLV